MEANLREIKKRMDIEKLTFNFLSYGEVPLNTVIILIFMAGPKAVSFTFEEY